VSWDTVNVASTTASAAGAWTAQFVVPASAGGSHNIAITGSVNSVPGISFQVTTAVTVSPTQDPPAPL